MTGKDPGYNRDNAWIQTATGGQFWPANPRIEDVNLIDIAASLSNQCRFTGHCLRFYSVAEHSVLVARWVWKETKDPVTALQAIIHDASEAYLTDIARPLKPLLPEYTVIEAKVQAVILDAFGISHMMPPIIKEADNRILFSEKEQNMAAEPQPWQVTAEPLPVKLKFWSPGKAKRIFIREFNQYWSRANG